MIQGFQHDRIVNILLKKCESREQNLIDDFLSVVRHLYRYEIFKNILDIVVTKCAINQLSFRIQDMTSFDMDAGNCLTMIEDHGYIALPTNNQSSTTALPSIRRKKYVITIKKIASDVIMHEIAHMLEQELFNILDLKKFADVLMYEIYNRQTTSMHLHQLLQSLFIDQLKGYPSSQHLSELFARFFQVFAGTNETAFQSSLNSRYKLDEITAVFRKTTQELDDQLSNNWKDLIDPSIANESKKYLKSMADIKESWANRRVEAKGFAKKGWSSNIKSIKDNPFK